MLCGFRGVVIRNLLPTRISLSFCCGCLTDICIICALVGDRPLAVNGKTIKASISMGGYWSRENHSIDELTRRADAQLLLAKQEKL